MNLVKQKDLTKKLIEITTTPHNFINTQKLFCCKLCFSKIVLTCIEFSEKCHSGKQEY